MYIDTHTRENMEKSICEYLGINSEDLLKLIEKVLFDENENMTTQEKQRYLITPIIIRLYHYNQFSIKNMSDDDNPILRLRDSEILDASFFKDKEEITEEMLKN